LGGIVTAELDEEQFWLSVRRWLRRKLDVMSVELLGDAPAIGMQALRVASIAAVNP
jgi:hypothetical protein